MNINSIRISLVSVLAALVVGALLLQQPATPANAAAESAVSLSPETKHRFASRLASRFMTSYHYRSPELDEAFSQRVFDQYLSALDPNRMYFTASDVEALSEYRDHMADTVRTADLEPAYDIFNRYVERSEERISHALSLLEQDFDFDVDEDYRFDRSEAPWAESDEELDELWRKRVKNDWLRLKLADQDEEEIVETLSERYENLRRRINEFNSEEVFSFFMNAFTRSIEPHSSYMSPRTSENFEISMRLSLEGIGAMLQRETEYTTVVEIVPGGPADLDGRLQPGDRIVGVGQGEDGEITDVVGWRLDDVVDKIRGERDTVVRLEVLPAETGMSGPPDVIRIVRNEVKLEEQAASSEVIELPDGDGTRRIGVIRVPVFYVDFEGRSRNEPNYRSSTRDVRKLINELKQKDVDGLVVDLRGNGGGALIEATTMTGLFIDTGPVVQVRDSRGKLELKSDNEPGMAWEGPLGVLVDRRSASASEIFAAAIQDYGRGVVIGEPTFGKGTVQNLIDLDNMARDEDTKLGQLKLTMAQFYRVVGGSTQNKGVIPDIRLPTPGDPDEYGESALDFAMPWAQIEPADFEPVADLDPLIELARHRHEMRLESDEELVELAEDMAEWEADSERKTISLLESERREEMEEAEERRADRFGAHDGVAMADDAEESDGASQDAAAEGEEDGAEAQDEGEEEEEDEDLYLEETVRILSDLIDLDQERLLAHRQTQ
ncbi:MULTISPECIES: carboxy terminal-processing peptidase [unclassified Wenzhouxiangella]|uniref:carboxy terminal-processing peptidase n=1 Tax=unclassified Wenzhouxiangella TaxID=2613841 RepID=UPI000E32A0C9|nr:MULTISPECIES: carboxy terminal-processing peptidase [unclassified Wenzhouxiangella]RFF27325.1 tail-specific protease [Wenzhouxiangella sp. 15181]RFP68758.1 tail-specific protease [Wenzhouxiangella sp. 15190]